MPNLIVAVLFLSIFGVFIGFLYNKNMRKFCFQIMGCKLIQEFDAVADKTVPWRTHSVTIYEEKGRRKILIMEKDFLYATWVRLSKENAEQILSDLKQAISQIA